METKDIFTGVGFVLTLGAWFVSYGRLSQKIEDLKESMDNLRSQSKEHYEHFGKLDNLAAAQAQINVSFQETNKEIKETLKEIMEIIRGKGVGHG